jgi:hypothetical protein
MLSTNNIVELSKVELVDGLGYALDDLKAKMKPEEWDAFSKYIKEKPLQLASDGRQCIYEGDLQLYIRLRTNALKAIDKKV